MNIPALADLLRETAEHHGAFEAAAPPHSWWDWYAAYMDARGHGVAPEAALVSAAQYMDECLRISIRRPEQED